MSTIIVNREVTSFPSHSVRYLVCVDGLSIVVSVVEDCHGDMVISDARVSPADMDRAVIYAYTASLGRMIDAARSAVESAIAADRKPGATRAAAIAMTPAGVAKLPSDW